MSEEKLIEALNNYGELVVNDIVAFLSTINKTNTGTLAKSLNFKARVEGNKIIAELKSVDYSEFVRLGVKGSISDLKAPNSPFSFGKTKTRQKNGLTSQIDKWVITKGITGTRDEKGRFIKRKSLVFLISRKIYRFGIKPTNFIFPFFKRLDELTAIIGEVKANEFRTALIKSFNNRS